MDLKMHYPDDRARAAERRFAVVRFGLDVAFTLNRRTLAVHENGLEGDGEEVVADVVAASYEAITGEDLGPPLEIDVDEILGGEEHEGSILALLDVRDEDPGWLYATIVENWVEDGGQGVLNVAAFCLV
ncbi:MAG: hypothetical protein M3Q10_16980, partial [Chloroflexota bacterium]|nr:hypothetical protein [Chloroflexota bacterium]